MLSRPSQIVTRHPIHAPPRIAVVTPAELWENRGPRSRALLAELRREFDGKVQIARTANDIVGAARLAASEAEVVVAAGGDGTVSRVSTGILGTAAALGIVPVGSTNIIAKSLGIPSQPSRALKLLSGNHSRRVIDVGVCDDRCFLHMAGAGFDAEIFRNTDLDWKRRTGWIAYLPPAMRALRYSAAHVRVTVDGVESVQTSPLVLVANGGSFISPKFRLHPDIAYDDGWLDILVFTCTTQTEILATLAKVSAGRAAASEHVKQFRGREILIEAEPPIWVELDGDPVGQTPRVFSLVPHGLTVITR